MLNKALHNEWFRMLVLLAASFLAALVVNTFVAPRNLYSGGLLGLSQLIRTLLDTHLGLRLAQVDLAGALYLLANVPLMVLAWRTLGRTFVTKLIFCTVTNSVFMMILPVPTQPIIDDLLTSCLVGGLLNGLANGVILTCGGSIGGMDILWLYLSKTRGYTVGRASFVFNALLYTLCLVLFDATTAIYSAIFSVVCATFIDRMHQQNITAQVLIVTKERTDELLQRIMKEIGRGVTYWDGRGAYTGDGVHVLCVCLSKYEIEQLRKMVTETDPHAFIMVQEGLQTAGNFQRHL